MPKMRWNCETQGCFNLIKRPKIEEFDDCFPGKIAFGDVDGSVEINSHELQLEWKAEGCSLPTGQRVKYERLTRKNDLVVIVVQGDAESMIVNHVTVYKNGGILFDKDSTKEELKSMIKLWADNRLAL